MQWVQVAGLITHLGVPGEGFKEVQTDQPGLAAAAVSEPNGSE